MGGFLGRNKEGTSGFWAVLDLDNYPRCLFDRRIVGIHGSTTFVFGIRQIFIETFHSFFLDFYSVDKDSFRISNGENQEIGNNGSKVNSKEEYYIQ